MPGEELGHFQAHEHLVVRPVLPGGGNAELTVDDFDLSLKELDLYRQAGGGSLCDAQPGGCGRDAGWLAGLSRRSGINIIASTGFHKLEYYPPGHWIEDRGEDELAGLFQREVTQGMEEVGDGLDSGNGPDPGGGQVRAGVIKAALDRDGLKGPYPRLLAAAARASVTSGAPILCHTERGAGALELVRFMDGLGVKRERLILCHLDRRADNPGFHQEVAATGVYLEYDTIGRPKYHDDQEEIRLISEMVETGFEDRLLLGLDTTRARLKAYGGRIGLDYLLTVFLPRLAAEGLSGSILTKLVRTNPARAFEIKPAWRPLGG